MGWTENDQVDLLIDGPVYLFELANALEHLESLVGNCR
jgi:hypothetical protein